MGSERDLIRSEFERAAHLFAERTAGRFDHLDVVSFSRADPGATVVEVGAGTGSFLELFGEVAGALVAVDLTEAMLRRIPERSAPMAPLLADGARLPIRSRSTDLVATAQTLHHVSKPLPVLKEMRRVAADRGRVLIVDQVATERFEEAVAMNELELLRDPSHAASRPPSGLRTMVRSVGLAIVDERVVPERGRLSKWMWPAEFPEERIESVRAFIEARGAETGMGFERDGDDWVFERRRIMLLAERS